MSASFLSIFAIAMERTQPWQPLSQNAAGEDTQNQTMIQSRAALPNP